MKVFTSNDGRKVNFVDDNNMLVGFDIYQNCCENFDYFFSTVAGDESEKYFLEENSMQDYSFINEEPQENIYVQGRDCEYCPTHSVTFMLEHKNGQLAYLTLHNTHNGYYSHGFSFQDSIGKIISQGGL